MKEPADGLASDGQADVGALDADELGIFEHECLGRVPEHERFVDRRAGGVDFDRKGCPRTRRLRCR